MTKKVFKRNRDNTRNNYEDGFRPKKKRAIMDDKDRKRHRNFDNIIKSKKIEDLENFED